MNSLLIDNYDSFTYNLFQLMAEVFGTPPRVVRNDELSWQEIAALGVDCIVLSPGPGHPREPRDFGVCRDVLDYATVPVLGICLGHQGLCLAAGAAVVHAPEPMHGRLSDITHHGDPLFAGVPSPFKVVRYHSYVAATPLPDSLQLIAETTDGLVMAVRHRHKPQWGLQFHPESIASQYGREIFKNFYRLSMASRPTATNAPTTPTTKITAARYQVKVKPLTKSLDLAECFLRAYATRNPCVWLDSNKTADAHSRFSILAALDGPLSHWLQYDVNRGELRITQQGRTQVVTQSLFTYLQTQLKHYATDTSALTCPFNLGYIGYLGFEMKAETLEINNRHRSPYPDAQFLFVDRALVYDAATKQLSLLALCSQDNSTDAEAWFAACETALAQAPMPRRQPDDCASGHFCRDRRQYLQDIERCLGFLRDGDSYEICLTNQWHAANTHDPIDFYFKLRQRNPAPYAALLRFGDLTIASASIERFLCVDAQRRVETKPIKGTVKRGRDAAEDLALRTQLAEDEKFQAENLMIVDLLRNDLGKVCEIGSVHVPTLMAVESYATVHQLVSTVRGQLHPEFDAVDALRACFPGGSMTGAPKRRTVEILDTLETEARGIYSGCIGYLALNGCADFNIVIRTAVFTPHSVSIGVGGAIITLSDPAEEYDEILLKAAALQQTLSPSSHPVIID